MRTARTVVQFCRLSRALDLDHILRMCVLQCNLVHLGTCKIQDILVRCGPLGPIDHEVDPGNNLTHRSHWYKYTVYSSTPTSYWEWVLLIVSTRLLIWPVISSRWLDWPLLVTLVWVYQWLLVCFVWYEHNGNWRLATRQVVAWRSNPDLVGYGQYYIVTSFMARSLWLPVGEYSWWIVDIWN